MTGLFFISKTSGRQRRQLETPKPMSAKQRGRIMLWVQYKQYRQTTNGVSCDRKIVHIFSCFVYALET